MTLSIRIRGINAEFAQVEREAAREREREVLIMARELLQAVREETPVDTGEAQRGWYVTDEQPLDITSPGFGAPIVPIPSSFFRSETQLYLVNPVEYIAELNQGSSSQAPARFIEATVLRFLTLMVRLLIVRPPNPIAPDVQP